MDETRTKRLEAYKEVQTILANIGPSKLTPAEVSTISWAAEGLLLASSSEDEECKESVTAFTTLMDDLETHRWSEMIGTAEHPGTARVLREAFFACAPHVPATA